jgi:hypothetical protein
LKSSGARIKSDAKEKRARRFGREIFETIAIFICGDDESGEELERFVWWCGAMMMSRGDFGGDGEEKGR